MKNVMHMFVLVLVLSIAFTSIAAQSANTFGVQRIDSKEAETIIGIPWVDMSTSGEGEIMVKDVVKTANLTVGDKLFWYDTSIPGYRVWVLKEEGGVKKWKGFSTSIKIGSVKFGTGTLNVIPAGSDDDRLRRGDAIVLFRQNPTTETGAANSFYVQGQVATSAASGVEFNKPGSSSSPFYTLFAPPIASADGVDVNSLAWSGITPTTESKEGDLLRITTASGDEILQWNGNKNEWGVFSIDMEVDFPDHPNGSWKTPRTTTILAGGGAWFVNRDSNVGKKVEWSK